MSEVNLTDDEKWQASQTCNFGAERILLGSDAPYGTDNLNLAISQMREAGMNNDDIELVCGKNIQKLLDIN